MRYYFDTKYIDDGRTMDLISIGIVSEDGRELYMCNRDCNFSKANDWVWDKVLTPIGVTKGPGVGAMRPIDPTTWVSRHAIREKVLDFCDGYFDESGQSLLTSGTPTPEFWSYNGDCDWVVFCQLFDPMMDLPQGFPMYCRDIKQWADMLDVEDLPGQVVGEHNALEDARHNKVMWEFLQNKLKSKSH